MPKMHLHAGGRAHYLEILKANCDKAVREVRNDAALSEYEKMKQVKQIKTKYKEEKKKVLFGLFNSAL